MIILLHVLVSMPIKPILARRPWCEEMHSKHLTSPMTFMKIMIVDMRTKMFVYKHECEYRTLSSF